MRAEGYGEIEYLVPEMSYVAAEYARASEVLRDRLLGRQEPGRWTRCSRARAAPAGDGAGTIVNATLEEYNAEIDAQVDAISDAMRDNPAQLDALSTQLTT